MSEQHFLSYMQQYFPNNKEREEFVDAYKNPVAKTISLMPATYTIASQIDYDHIFDTNRKLSSTVFTENPYTKYVDREDREIALGKTRQHLTGRFYIQELAASLPAYALPLSKGSLILDMAAAPGGKSVQLASRLAINGAINGGELGLVWANDFSSKRLATWGQNIQRIGLTNLVATSYDGNVFGTKFPELFDFVLCDAPCSGEGTAFKSSTAVSYRRSNEIKMIADLQHELLVSACKTVKVGGYILYATCTINPIENEYQIAKILETYPGQIVLHKLPMHGVSEGLEIDGIDASITQKVGRCWPHIQKTGGFFMALLQKITPIYTSNDIQTVQDQRKQSKELQHSQTLQKQGRKYLSDTFGVPAHCLDIIFVQDKEKIYAVSSQFLSVIKLGYFHYIGQAVAKVSRDGWIPLHGMGQVFGSYATKRIIALNEQETDAYCNHQSIKRTDIKEPGFFILCHKGLGISIGKYVGGEIKNKFCKW